MILINEYKVSEVICLKCYKRWKAARPISVHLNELECPQCSETGFAIETGETSVAEDLLNDANKAN